MIRVAGICFDWRGNKYRQIPERLVIPIPYFLTPLPVFIHSWQLMDTYRRLQIHHIIFKSRVYDLVIFISLIAESFPGILAHSVQAKDLDLVSVFLFIGNYHTAFTGNNILGNIEAETPQFPESSRLLPAVFRLNSVRAILYDPDIMFSRDTHYFIHFAGAPGKMNGDNGFCFRSNFSLNVRGINIHCIFFAISENRDASGMNYRVGSCGKGH